MIRLSRIVPLLLLGWLAVGCGDLEQEINLKLPPFERQLVVECYVYPGDSVVARITEAVPFLDPPGLNDLPTAKVYLRHHGTTDTLVYEYNIEGIFGKGYNYIARKTIPYDPGATFEIEVIDTLTGRVATASCTMMPVVPIDSIDTPYRSDLGLSQVLAGFQDDPNTVNFYRFIAQQPGDILSTENDVDFAPDDQLINGQFTFFGTRFLYNNLDSTDVYLYNLEQAHYRFIITAFNAEAANGNPFATPTLVESNVQGGTGIFAAPGRDVIRVTIVQP